MTVDPLYGQYAVWVFLALASSVLLKGGRLLRAISWAIGWHFCTAQEVWYTDLPEMLALFLFADQIYIHVGRLWIRPPLPPTEEPH